MWAPRLVEISAMPPGKQHNTLPNHMFDKLLMNSPNTRKRTTGNTSRRPGHFQTENTHRVADAQHIHDNTHRWTLHELTTSIRKKMSTNDYPELDIFNNNSQYYPSFQNPFSDLFVAQKCSCGHLDVELLLAKKISTEHDICMLTTNTFMAWEFTQWRLNINVEKQLA